MDKPNSLIASEQLRLKLENFDLDSDAPLSFSKRLARENGWSLEFSQRVVAQYKRFLFLAHVCSHPVTPSDEVDQAWHLHLTYSRSYWQMCDEIFGAPFHHEPTRGGASENDKFELWYAKTLDSYFQIFGEAAPADIWPPAAIRFGHAPHFRRVNLKTTWVLGKPRFPKPQKLLARVFPMIFGFFALFASAGAAFGQTGWQVFNPFDWDGPTFLAFFWLACLLSIPLAIASRRAQMLPNDAQFPLQTSDFYAVARLTNTGTLPIDAALASLQMSGKIEVKARGQIEKLNSLPPIHAWEKRVFEAIGPGRETLFSLRNALQSSLVGLDVPLIANGLVLDSQARRRVDDATLVFPLVLMLIGAIKIFVGLNRGRPVEFLVLTGFVLLAIAFYFATAGKARLSGRGLNFLKHLRTTQRREDLRSQALAGQSAALVLALSLWGYGELDAMGLRSLHQAMRPPGSGGNGGSSGGDSDGGSGCGGGGCGGCGGGD